MTRLCWSRSLEVEGEEEVKEAHGGESGSEATGDQVWGALPPNGAGSQVRI